MQNQDSAALWAAIRATPEDDLPRLALADWLEENEGEAGQVRARLIRLQCEIARLEKEGEEGIPSPRIPALNTEADRLIRKHKETLLAGLPVGNGFAMYFRRGIPENAIARSGKDFLRRADKAFAASPITSLHFSTITGESLEAVLGRGYLRGIRDLGVEVDEYRREPDLVDVARLLSASPDVSEVRSLDMYARVRIRSTTNRSSDVMLALANGQHWSSLNRIGLGAGGELSAEALQALSSARKGGIEELVLGGTILRPAALTVLARGFPTLRVLEIAGRHFDDNAAEVFAKAKALSHLRSLEISGNASLDDPAALVRLLTSAGLPELTILRLQGRHRSAVSDLASVRAGKVRRPATLRTLNLSGFGFADADVAVLARLPSLRGLSWLDLEDNQFGAEGAAALAGVEWERLARLDLGANEIDAHGAQALAASPRLARLRHLDLRNNPIGPEGARAIARSAHLGGLWYLRLESAEVDAKAFAELKERFGRKGWSGKTFVRPEGERG
jgi:uncharacterized protein (TIGR02996 family)